MLVNPWVQKRFVLYHNQLLLAQTHSGCHPAISAGSSATELAQAVQAAGDLISIPSRKVGFPGMAWSCSPTSPILHIWLWSL